MGEIGATSICRSSPMLAGRYGFVDRLAVPLIKPSACATLPSDHPLPTGQTVTAIIMPSLASIENTHWGSLG